MFKVITDALTSVFTAKGKPQVKDSLYALETDASSSGIKLHAKVLAQIELRLCLEDDLDGHPIWTEGFNYSDSHKFECIDCVIFKVEGLCRIMENRKATVRHYPPWPNLTERKSCYHAEVPSPHKNTAAVAIFRAVTRAVTRLAYLKHVDYEGLCISGDLQASQLGWEMNAIGITPLQIRQVLVSYFKL